MTRSLEKKQKIAEGLKAVLTPIFTQEIGERLGLMRMSLLLTQADLGARFGTSQRTISAIESGKQMTTAKPFSIADMNLVFNDEQVEFVLTGAHAYRVLKGNVWKRYWNTKHKREMQALVESRQESEELKKYADDRNKVR